MNSYIKSKFIFLITLLLTGSVMGQQQLSLSDAIQLGLENNYQIRIFEGNLEMTQNNNAWGTAGLFPTLTLGAVNANRYDDRSSVILPGTRDKYGTNSISPYIDLRLNLFSGFRVHIAKSQLALVEELSGGNVALVMETTIQGIILAYYNTLLQTETQKVLMEVKKLSRDRFDYVNFRKELGSAVTYDVLQAKNAYYSDSTTYLQQELNVKNAFLNLRLLLGEETDVEYILTDEFTVNMRNFQLDSLSVKMNESNKTLMNQYVNLEILKKEIQLQKSYMYPSLNLNAGFDHYNSRVKYDNMNPSYSNGLDFYGNLSLSFNLSNGGNARRAIRNAKIEQEIGEIETDELKVNLGNQLKNYYDLYNIRKQLLSVAEVNIESANLNLQISTEKFKSGSINSFNFRDVQVLYLNAAVSRLRAIYNLIDTHAELLRITGGIITEY
ncbi:TolC family protein [Bacteroidota bacterium]